MDLNFCPCCFNEYDEDNLAYELAFPKNWNWEKIKDETVVGATGKIPAYISEQDGRRERYFKKQTGTKPIILKERPTGSRIKKTSLEFFIEHVRFKEKEATPVVNDMDSEYQNPDEDDESAWGTESEFLALSKYADLPCFITSETKQEAMYVIPCCPTCHMRLPMHWDTADDFCGIDLMARTASGKTTLLCSMLSEEWEALQGFTVQGRPVNIAPAQYKDSNPGDEYYKHLVKSSEEMVENRKCPDPTPPGFDWTPPVFLQVKFDDAGGTKHTMIVGVYDNPGETLEQFNLMDNPSLKPIVDQMFADIHLFDPEQMMNPAVTEQVDTHRTVNDSDCRVMSLEEQSEQQRKNVGRRMTAAQLLGEAADQTGQENTTIQQNPFKTYHALTHGRATFNNALGHMREMHCACVIVKSDLLVERMQNTPYSILFNRVPVQDQVDYNNLGLKDQMIRQLIDQMQLFGNYQIPNFDVDYRSACWHCVSATGCACGSEELQGAYAPINIAAPLVSCLIKRIQENGWIS